MPGIATFLSLARGLAYRVARESRIPAWRARVEVVEGNCRELTIEPEIGIIIRFGKWIYAPVAQMDRAAVS
jgi:hypothetical protein